MSAEAFLPSMCRKGRLYVVANAKEAAAAVAEMMGCDRDVAMAVVRGWTEQGLDYAEELIKVAIATDTED